MNILLAILTFGGVVFIHELGHFLLAKKNGITVVEFSMGMGPRIISKTKGGTKYSLKLFPFGGSCAMLGEDDTVDQEGAFHNKNVWARISTIFAGPFFNFLFAFLLSLVVVILQGYDLPVVSDLKTDGVAYEAGLREGDVITEYNGSNIVFYKDLSLAESMNPIQNVEPIRVIFERDGKRMETTLVPKLNKTYALGFDYERSEGAVTITSLQEGFPLDKAGLTAGDIITNINGVKINSGNMLLEYLVEHPLTNSEISVTYTRNDEINIVKVTPIESIKYNTNLLYGKETHKAQGFEVVKYGFAEVGYWIKATVKSLGMLFTGQVGVNQLNGPVGLISDMNTSVKESEAGGIIYVISSILGWGILISANLGVMNLLPIPALDGGKLVFLLLEALRGKPFNRDKEGYIHAAGYVMLMGLMVFVFYHDIRAFF